MHSGSSSSASGPSGVNISPRMIIGGILAVLAVVFVFQNTDSAKLKIIFFTVEMPRWIAFLVLLVIGAIIGYIFRRSRDRA